MTADATGDLARHKFVSLTTFKKSGDAVATPMWIGCDDDRLFVWTPADSGKVKRLRNNSRVVLAPSTRTGKVGSDAPSIGGTAEVITDTQTIRRLAEVIRRKYGLEFRIVTFIERLIARGPKPRVILRIALDAG